MRKKKIFRYVSIFLISLFLFIGCGSSNGDDKNSSSLRATPSPQVTVVPSPTVQPSPSPKAEESVTKTKGYLIDSPVEGADYVCTEGTGGLTDAKGMFECEKAPVTFKVGKLTLGTLEKFTADGKVYLQDLLGLERETYSDEKLKLLAQLIQSLDDDGLIEDKITITKEVRDALTKEQNFKDMTEYDVRILLRGLKKDLVEECGSVKHLGDTSVECNGDGSYYYVEVVTTPTPSPIPTVTPSPIATVTPSPIPTSKNNLKITLKTTEKIAGYEVHLKFTDDTPSSVTMNNSFLGTNGRTVSDLGPDINSITKEVKFGAFTFGSQEAVTGEFDVLSFKTNDSKSQVTITKKSCVDKDANDISCDIEIK